MSSKSTIIASAAGLSVAAVAVGGFAAVSFLGGGGAQPEDVLPANTIAFVKVDLDPSAGQKVNVYKLTQKFDSLDVKGKGSVKDDLLKALFSEADEVDYDKDIKPWIGDRAAVAAVPHTEDGATPLIVVQFTDEDEMTASLDKIAQTVAEDQASEPVPGTSAPESDVDDFAYAVRDDYVLIGEDQSVVDAAAESKDVLADDTGFTEDVEALGGDQIVTGWADVEAAYDAVPDKEEFTGAFAPDAEVDDLRPSGSVVMGVSAQSDHIEFVAKALNVEAAGFAAEDAAAFTGSGLVTEFPADAVAAVSVAGLDTYLVEAWDTFGGDLGLDDDIAGLGLDLPDDLAAVFGSETAVGLTLSKDFLRGGEDPNIFGKVLTDDPERGAQVLAMIAEGYAFTETGDGYYTAGSSPEAVADATAGGLGDSETFKKVVKDAENASAVVFVNIASIVDMLGEDPDQGPDDSLSALDAFGLSVSGDSDEASITARLSVR